MPRSSRPSRREATLVEKGDLVGYLSEQLTKQATEPNLLGYTPHALQEPFHRSEKQIRAYIGGNRSGKSTAGVVEDLWWCTKRHPYRRLPDGPIRGRIVGVSFIDGVEKVLLPLVKRWVVPSDLINGSWEDSWDNDLRTLYFKNKSFLEFMSTDQQLEKHSGTSRHFVHMDEEPPRAYYQENLLRLVDTNGCMWLTLTPVEGMTWVYDDIFEPWEKGTAADSIDVYQVDMDDNPFLPEAGKKLIMGTITDQDELAMRKSGRFAPKGGLIFPEFRRNTHCVVQERWRPARMDVLTGKLKIYNSIDHGINNPTAIYWHAVDEKGMVITFHEYYRSQLLVKDHVEYIKNYEQKVLGLTPDQIYLRTGDPAMKQRNGITGTSVRQAYSDLGIYLALDNLPRDVQSGIDRMKGYMQLNPVTGLPTWRLVKGACSNLERELERLHWKTHPSARARDGLNKIEEVHKKDDHGFDSCRYFFTLLPDLSADHDEWNPSRNLEPRLDAPRGSYLDTIGKMRTQWQETSFGTDQQFSEYTAMEAD